jgi:hypothetical protein
MSELDLFKWYFIFFPQHYHQFINLDGFVVDKKCLDMFKVRSCMWWHLSTFCNDHYMSFRFYFQILLKSIFTWIAMLKQIWKWLVHECKTWTCSLWTCNLKLNVILIHLHGHECVHRWMISHGWMSILHGWTSFMNWIK